MIVIENSETLEVLTDATATTTEPCFSVGLVSAAGSTFVLASSENGATNGTTAVAMVTGVASTQKRVMGLSVYNRDTVSRTVTIRRSSTVLIIKAVIASGGSLQYESSKGWMVHDANGVLQFLTVPTQITVANEATDTTCFLSFVTGSTGDLGPKTNSALTFNSSTGALGATTIAATGKAALGGSTVSSTHTLDSIGANHLLGANESAGTGHTRTASTSKLASIYAVTYNGDGSSTDHFVMMSGYGYTSSDSILYIGGGISGSHAATDVSIYVTSSPNSGTGSQIASFTVNGLSLNGKMLANNSIGYKTGAGAAVTQATSRTTGVTCDGACGAVTLVSAAGSTTPASLTVNNSLVGATDCIILSQKSGTDKYICLVTAVGSGSFQMTLYTTGGTTTEQPVISFALIKSVTS